MKDHTWQIHGDIRVCEDCGIARHKDRMEGVPPCDPTELDAAKVRIDALFLQKLAERYPDHPWVKK